MERLHYRSTSLVDIQAELHQQELLRDSRATRPMGLRRRRRALPLALRLLHAIVRAELVVDGRSETHWVTAADDLPALLDGGHPQRLHRVDPERLDDGAHGGK